jgi:hypothetical protein
MCTEYIYCNAFGLDKNRFLVSHKLTLYAPGPPGGGGRPAGLLGLNFVKYTGEKLYCITVPYPLHVICREAWEAVDAFLSRCHELWREVWICVLSISKALFAVISRYTAEAREG